MGTTSNINEASTPAALKERLVRAQRELEALRHKASRATSTTIIVGIIALVAIGGYFYYGYSQISTYTEPDKLVGYAQQIVDDQLPSVRQSLKEQIIKSAPSWAEGLSKQALESLPTGRAKLESYVMEQYDSSAQETITLTDQQFREFLHKNRPMLEQKFKELAAKPQLADDSLAEVQARLEESLQADMHAQAGQFLDTLQSLDAKLKKLRSAQNLTPEEATERRLLMLVRRMRMEEKDPSLAGKQLAETPREEIRPVAFRTGKPGAVKGRPVTARPELTSKPAAKPGKPDGKSPAVKVSATTATQAPTTTGSKPQGDKEAKPAEDKNDKKDKSGEPGKDKAKQ
jgi:acyl transferase domain-containing protein